MCLGRRLDRLAIRDVRRLEEDVYAEAALQFCDGHFDVNLPLARQQQFLRLRVAAVANGRVFLFQSVHRLVDLVFVGAALRLDRVGQHRFLEPDRRVATAIRLLTQRIVGERVLQLGDGTEIVGLDLRDDRRRLALQ